jgi:hypothetical protein
LDRLGECAAAIVSERLATPRKTYWFHLSDLAKLSPQESKKLAIKEQRRQARMLAATVAVLD